MKKTVPVREDQQVALPLDSSPAPLPGEPPHDMGFLARAFVATTLPHRDPKAETFTRTNGDFRLSLTAPKDVGLPSGRYPRLILPWLITQAVIKKTPLLEPGPSLSNFARQLGITPTSGPRGTLTVLRSQLNKLLSMSVDVHWSRRQQSVPLAEQRPLLLSGTAEHTQEKASVLNTRGGYGFRIATRHELWWSGRESGIYYIQLSSEFFNEVSERPIPIDLNVVRALSSSFELDLYGFLCWRSVRSQRIQRPEMIPWPSLMQMFGAVYSQERQFRFNLLRALKVVLKYYPVRVESTAQGLVLGVFEPHIPLKRRLVAVPSLPAMSLPFNQDEGAE